MSSFYSWFSSSSTNPPKVNKKPAGRKAQETEAEKKKKEDYDLAGDLTKRAVQAEQSDPSEALRLYKQAMAIWVELVRVETNEEKRKELSEFIDHYMRRAEVMKTVVSERDKAAKDFKNYATPTVSSTKKAPARPRKTNQVPQARRTGTGPGPKQAAATTQSNEYETQIMSDMLDSSPGVRWSDISGLEYAKSTIHEAVVMPNLRPDLFSGLRSPPKGVLLFGPPGTGKTMLAKAVATESGFNFFSISSSSVTSKYVGEGEKLMKAVFDSARKKQPSVIFFDEIDALLSSRKENEHECSRRLKTEFMVQLDGAASCSDDRILIIGATNIPWELDEAVLRRLVKRIYVPLPESETRQQLITQLIRKQEDAGEGAKNKITQKALTNIVKKTEGYSASDINALCKEAAMGPLREIPRAQFATFNAKNLRAISETDFLNALKTVRPSVSGDSLGRYREWSSKFGVQS